VTQWTHAVAYRGRWSRLIEVTAGLQKTRYEKQVTEPGAVTPQLGKDDPWLYNAGVALYQTDKLAWYASYSTGLEEGGVAPENAANKSAAPPAIRTRQWDAGARYAFTPALKLVVGVFDIQKPYYGLDDASFFRELGEERHRGVELSLAGEIVDGLNVVLGTVLIEPRVSGEEVANGTIGKVPVGQTERVSIGSVEYQLPWVKSLSLSATVTSVDDRMASSDNQLSIPARSVYDLGARYRFQIGRAPATLRFSFGNVFDKFGWRTNSSEVFVTNAPRRIAITLAADFPGGQH
jgi:iron complex outermembrane recepter protein